MVHFNESNITIYIHVMTMSLTSFTSPALTPTSDDNEEGDAHLEAVNERQLSPFCHCPFATQTRLCGSETPFVPSRKYPFLNLGRKITCLLMRVHST